MLLLPPAAVIRVQNRLFMCESACIGPNTCKCLLHDFYEGKNHLRRAGPARKTTTNLFKHARRFQEPC